MIRYLVLGLLLTQLSYVIGGHFKMVKVAGKGRTANEKAESGRFFLSPTVLQNLINLKQGTTTTVAPTLTGSLTGTITGTANPTGTLATGTQTVTGGGAGTGTGLTSPTNTATGTGTGAGTGTGTGTGTATGTGTITGTARTRRKIVPVIRRKSSNSLRNALNPNNIVIKRNHKKFTKDKWQRNSNRKQMRQG